MKIIFLSSFCKRTGSFDICVPRAAALAGILIVGVLVAAVGGGYLLGEKLTRDAMVQDEAAQLRELLNAERRVIADAKVQQRANLDALSAEVAQLQARLVRLDALGERLVDVGKLDRDEFDFAASPPIGGIEEAQAGDNIEPSELSVDMVRLAQLLDDREDKLSVLENMLMTRDVMAEVTPSGRPVAKGWISSRYGRRTDPLSGKKSYHRGVDFAGKRGTSVVAVASGVVLRSQKGDGYGNLVELKHADGYSTLYAHNQENLVEVGDVVTKGQTIALLGNTGRSSGPHVHFEVHRNGKIVDPIKFVKSR